ncbi:MAG: hypothetical protein K0S24_4554, partial [Sphingobacterium sp.]|nr:hypothetical protein [Sphingobacterium sp.]
MTIFKDLNMKQSKNEAVFQDEVLTRFELFKSLFLT